MNSKITFGFLVTLLICFVYIFDYRKLKYTVCTCASDIDQKGTELVGQIQCDENERSHFQGPSTFDMYAWGRYIKYRSEYVSTPEPGRVLQEAEPGKGVGVIGDSYAEEQVVSSGDSTFVRVFAPSGYPVNFYSPQGGRFVLSGIDSASVIAEGGIAEVEWEASDEALGMVMIMASSPVAFGKTFIYVQVVKY